MFVQFVNNFPFSCDQGWFATFLSYHEETKQNWKKDSQPRLRVGCLVTRASERKALGRGWLDWIRLSYQIVKYCGINKNVFFIAELVVVVIAFRELLLFHARITWTTSLVVMWFSRWLGAETTYEVIEFRLPHPTQYSHVRVKISSAVLRIW